MDRSASCVSCRGRPARSAVGGETRVKDRYELAAELAPRYWKGSRRERGAILDAFCLATGYHRKYAMAGLRGRRRVGVRHRVARAHRYGVEFQQALLVA